MRPNIAASSTYYLSQQGKFRLSLFLVCRNTKLDSHETCQERISQIRGDAGQVLQAGLSHGSRMSVIHLVDVHKNKLWSTTSTFREIPHYVSTQIQMLWFNGSRNREKWWKHPESPANIIWPFQLVAFVRIAMEHVVGQVLGWQTLKIKIKRGGTWMWPIMEQNNQ